VTSKFKNNYASFLNPAKEGQLDHAQGSEIQEKTEGVAEKVKVGD
jgi:hypothetical protein